MTDVRSKTLRIVTLIFAAVLLAAALSAAGKKQQALELLYAVLKQDLTAAEVKKTFLDILSTMAGDPLQKQYRNKLYTLLY